MLIAILSRHIASTCKCFDQVLNQGDYYLVLKILGRWPWENAGLSGIGQIGETMR